MNNWNGIGRLVRDPEVRQTNSGASICRFTLAIDRPKAKDGTRASDFISCVAFGKTGEVIAKYLSKGRQAGVTGRIQTGSYQKNGQKVYTTDVVVTDFTFVGNKNDGANAGGGYGAPAAPSNSDPADNFDIPF